MKYKLLFILFILTLMVSCKPAYYSIGMTESEFLKKNHSANIVESTSDHSIYLRVNWKAGAGRQYFYFRDGILIGTDYGVMVPDVYIQYKH